MIIKRSKTFSTKKDDRENVPKELLEKAKKDGVVQKYDGSWRIISIQSGKFWNIKEDSKEKCEQILKAYQANRH